MLISAKELGGLMENGADVVVFDCRFQLADKAWGKTQYLNGHIQNAKYLDLEKDMSSEQALHGGRHPFPDSQKFVQKLSLAGVAEATTVVVYDSGEGMATRAWWLIRYFGHNDVRVLNGGLPAWVAAGYTLTDEIPVSTHTTFVPNIHTDWTVDYSEIRRLVDENKANGCLIDARAAKRYRGEVEPMDHTPGHIPGAANAPWQDGIDESGFWKGSQFQQERFREISSNDENLIVYCGSGVTACATLFALELAGIQNARLYPGSWSDWISYEDSPIAKGKEKR